MIQLISNHWFIGLCKLASQTGKGTHFCNFCLFGWEKIPASVSIHTLGLWYCLRRIIMSSGLYHMRQIWYHTQEVGKCRNTRFSLWWYFSNGFLLKDAHFWTRNRFMHVNRYPNYSPTSVKDEGNKTERVYKCFTLKNKMKMEFLDRLLCNLRRLWVFQLI